MTPPQRTGRARRIGVLVAALLSLGAAATPSSPAAAAEEPAPAASAMPFAPYFYNGWGDPPDPLAVMEATGVRHFTLAFILSNGYCDPQWDGARPLTGGADEQLISQIRAAGGDVVPSFGGWSGNKLESSCATAEELAAAYQAVIDAYGLTAIDIDLEAEAYDDPATQQRTVDALAAVKAANPGLEVYVTIGSYQSGPDTSLIDRAAAAGLTVDAWTIMPFNFGGTGQDMGQLTITAAEGLNAALRSAYGYTQQEAYQVMGISSMNGLTDVGETVTVADFETILGYTQQNGLARLAFWSVNRDRNCTGGSSASCSGVSQSDWEYTRVFAQFAG